MAKLSAVNKNKKRIKLSDRLYKKRQALKKIVMDKKIPLEVVLIQNLFYFYYYQTPYKNMYFYLRIVSLFDR